jgi:hypothetical protein
MNESPEDTIQIFRDRAKDLKNRLYMSKVIFLNEDDESKGLDFIEEIRPLFRKLLKTLRESGSWNEEAFIAKTRRQNEARVKELEELEDILKTLESQAEKQTP